MKIKEYMLQHKKIAIISIIALALILIIGISIIKYFMSPAFNFKNSLNTMNIEALTDIYSKAKSYDDKKSIENIFQNKLDEEINEFITGTKTYEEVKNELETLSKITQLQDKTKNTLEKLDNIKNSKDNFSKAKESEEKGNSFEAYKFYLKVIDIDKQNYNVAQSYIVNNKSKIKDNVFEQVDNFINQNNYIEASNKLNELKELIKDDNDINEKINKIEEKVNEQKIEKYRNEQEVIVESTRILSQDTPYKSLYPDMIEVIIKNNSSKTIKDYNVSILAYDSNNYPLKINTQYNFGNINYELIGKGEGANVTPNSTFGKDKGYSLNQDHGISKTIAIVKDVTYYDGSKWENPYYTYWLDEHKEKPLQ